MSFDLLHMASSRVSMSSNLLCMASFQMYMSSICSVHLSKRLSSRSNSLRRVNNSLESLPISHSIPCILIFLACSLSSLAYSLTCRAIFICSIRCNVLLVFARPANNYLIICKSSASLALWEVKHDHQPLGPLGPIAARVAVFVF